MLTSQNQRQHLGFHQAFRLCHPMGTCSGQKLLRISLHEVGHPSASCDQYGGIESRGIRLALGPERSKTSAITQHNARVGSQPAASSSLRGVYTLARSADLSSCLAVRPPGLERTRSV